MKKVQELVRAFTYVSIFFLGCTEVSIAANLTQKEVFEVSLTIPEPEFQVFPVEPSILTHAQTLVWDVRRKKFVIWSAFFDVNSKAGPVSARLDAVPLMKSPNGNSFKLIVRFNGKLLSDDAVTVLDRDRAQAGSRVVMEIEPTMPDNGFVSDSYYGNVSVIFDAVI